MEKNKNNPVSSEIINKSVWNSIGDYLPVIINRSDMHMQSWIINARLPESFCKKWIAYIIGDQKFREMIEEKIENIFRNHVFDGQSFLEIRWHSKGVSFETDGVNGCMIYVYAEGGYYGYISHNINTSEQVDILFLALSQYLPALYSALNLYEREKAKLKLSQTFPEGEIIYKRIILHNKQSENKEIKDCQTTLETFSGKGDL